MLIYQALAQVRIFVGGDPALELASEPEVLEAMRSAVLGTA
jgi:shikimate dehydrogenase